MPAWAAEEPFEDVSPDDWFAPYIQTALDSGLMSGTGAGQFQPDRPVTVGEATVITARLAHLYITGDGTLEPAPAWYWAQEPDGAGGVLRDLFPGWLLDALYYIAEFGGAPLETDQFQALGPEGVRQMVAAPATRRDLAWSLCNILVMSQESDGAIQADLEPINQVDYLPDTGDPDILTLCRAGIFTGTDAYGTFHGDWTLTRGELAAALARALDPSLRVAFTLTPTTQWENFSLTPISIPEGYCVDQPFLPHADQFEYLSDGPFLHLVSTGHQEYQDRREGLLDSSGAWLIPPEYRVVFSVGPDGVAAAYTTDGGAVFLDLQGQELTPRSPTCATGYYHNGALMLAESCNGNTLHKVYDTEGALIAALPDTTQLIALEGRVAYQDETSGLWGFYGLDGAVAIPAAYEAVEPFYDGLAAVQQEGLWGFIDQAGALVIPARYQRDPEYHQVFNEFQFLDGMAVVPYAQEDGSFLYGVIDRLGNEVLPGVYRWLGRISDGMAAFRRDYDSGYVDLSTGTEIPVTFNGNLGTGTPFSEGMAVLRTGGYGYIDKSGAPVTPDLFDYAGPVRQGQAVVLLAGRPYLLRFHTAGEEG